MPTKIDANTPEEIVTAIRKELLKNPETGCFLTGEHDHALDVIANTTQVYLNEEEIVVRTPSGCLVHQETSNGCYDDNNNWNQEGWYTNYHIYARGTQFREVDGTRVFLDEDGEEVDPVESIEVCFDGDYAIDYELYMPHRFYVVYPGDFANEYTVFAVPAAKVDAFLEEEEYAEEIDKVRAWSLGTKQPHEYEVAGQQHFGGWASEKESKYHDRAGQWSPEPADVLPDTPEGWKSEEGDDGWVYYWLDTPEGKSAADSGTCLGLTVRDGIVYYAFPSGEMKDWDSGPSWNELKEQLQEWIDEDSDEDEEEVAQ